jgi:hypothetical protein
MKKLLLSTTALLACYSLFAGAPGDDKRKTTIEIHGKGIANSTFLFNKNISDAGNSQDYAAGWGFNYGVGYTMYFGKCGFAIEGLFGNHTGAYAGTIDLTDTIGNVVSTEDYTSSVNLTITQIPVLFKLKSETGGYFEVGPQYNLISEAKYNFTGMGINHDTIITKEYKSYVSAVIGVGFKVPVPKTRFSVLAGLRLQYSLTDLEGVDGLGTPFKNPFAYKEPGSTSAATGGFMLGAVYTIGEKNAKKEKKK